MKKKILSWITTGIFALGALMFGVYALIKAGMTFSGGIAFNPNGVYIELSGQVYRGKSYYDINPVYEDESYTYEKQTNYSESGTKSISGWHPKDVRFTPIYNLIQYKMTFKNISSADISVVPSEVKGVPSGVKAFEEAADVIKIAPGKEGTYCLSFRLQDGASDFKAEKFSLVFDIKYTSEWENASYYQTNSAGNEITALTSTYTSNKPRLLAIPQNVKSGVNVTAVTHVNNSGTYVGALSLIDDTVTKYIIFPDTVTTLGSNTCANKMVTNVVLPKNLTTMDDTAGNASFVGPHRANFKIAADAPNFYTEDGCLYNSAKDFLWYGAGSRDEIRLLSTTRTMRVGVFDGRNDLAYVQLNEGLTEIGWAAFWRVYAMKSLVIPSTVKTIGDSAFYCCTGLETLTIPSSVTTIKTGVFHGCENLKWIRLDGNRTLNNTVTLEGNWAKSSTATQPSSFGTVTIGTTGNDGYYHQQVAYN